jgi:transposase
MTTNTPHPNAREKGREPWCGCDVAKASFEAAIRVPAHDEPPCSMQAMEQSAFERTREGVREFLNWADQVLEPFATDEQGLSALRVVMEATGKYSLELALWMTEERASLSPAIINPQTARAFARSLSLRNKTDKTDARALAIYGFERRPVAYEPASRELSQLRLLSRHRQRVIEMRVSEENRLQEPNDSPLVRKMLTRHIAQLRRDEKRLEEEMKKIIDSIPWLKRDAQAMDHIYGVGFITASSLLAELGDLRRFKKARQLSACGGISPRQHRSGQSVHHKTRMSKKGSSYVRKALYMPAMAAIGGDNDLAHFYYRLIHQGNPKKVALGAVMRKLLLTMRAILISGEPYQKHYRKPCGKLMDKNPRIQPILA